MPNKEGDDVFKQDDDFLKDDPSDGDIDDIDDDDDDGKNKDKDDKKSLTIQKDKYRKKSKELGDALGKANEKIAQLEKKEKSDDGLSADEKKEKQAQEYIRSQAREEFKKLQREEEDSKKEKERAYADEMDEVLDDNPDLTKTKVEAVIKRMKQKGLEITPKQAVGIMDDLKEDKKTARKPKLPKSSRGDGTVKSDDDDDEDEMKGKSFDERMNIVRKKAYKRLEE